MAKKQGSGRTETGQFAAGVSGNPKGRPPGESSIRLDDIPEAVRGEISELIDRVRNDGWQSSVTGIGQALTDKRKTAEFVVEPVSDEEARTIYRGDDMGAKCVEIYPHHMLREGFDLVITDAKPAADTGDEELTTRQQKRAEKRRMDAAAAKAKELSERAMKVWKRLKGKKKFFEALTWARAYGGSGIVLGAKDGSTDWAKPLNLNSIRSLDFLTTLEARELTPAKYYADPLKANFGEVATWTINAQGQAGAAYEAVQIAPVEIHASRLIHFQGIRVSRDDCEGTHQGHGDSIFTRVKGVLRDFNIGWDAASIILHEFSLATMKIKGLSEMVSTDAQKKLLARMAAVQLGRSVANVTLVDEGEEYSRDMATVTGLADILEKFMVRLAAAFGVPVTLLMGVSPAGLNATGASDIRSFYDKIAAEQVDELEPQLLRVFEIILRMLNGGKLPESWNIEFKPLWQETPKEQAETRKIVVETALSAIEGTLITAAEARKSIYGGEKFSPDIVIDQESEDDLDVNPAELDAQEKKLDANGKPIEPELGPDGKPLPAPENGEQPGAPKKEGEVTIVPTDKPVSNSALNGAQGAMMLAIVTAYTSKQIDRRSAKAQLLIALPIDDKLAEDALGDETFVAATPAPAAAPFGGGAPGEDEEPKLGPDGKPIAPKPGEKKPPVPPAKPEAKRSEPAA